MDVYASIVSLLIVSCIYYLYTQQQAITNLKSLNKTFLKVNFELNEKVNKSLEKFETLSNAYENLINDFEHEVVKNGILNNLETELKLRIEENKKQFETTYSEMKKTHTLDLKDARKDALNKSRAVMRGQATEHLAPYVMKGINPKDCRFMGNPVDYIVFDGLSDVTDKISNEIKEVKFIDIKTGNSNLNTAQRRIRDAIKNNRVSFEIVNPDKLQPIQKEEKENANKSKV